MANALDLLLPPLWVGVACSVVYTAIDSPLRPVHSILKSWGDAFALVSRRHVLALGGLTIFLATPLLHYFIDDYMAQFSAFDRELLLGPSNEQLLFASLAWQALAAGLLGLMALNLYVEASRIDDFYEAPPLDVFNRRCALWAFGAGVGAYLALVVADFGFNRIVDLLPSDWQPLGGTATFWIRALLFAILALVRPALSLGAQAPLHAAFEAFAKRPVAFLIWVSALSIPLGLAQFGKESFVESGDLDPTSYWLGNGCLAVFDVVNYVACEMATFRMLRNLLWDNEEEYGLEAAVPHSGGEVELSF